MSEEQPRHLVVGRLRKPHGLKGDVTVFPLTDDPELAFASGRSVWIKKVDGEVIAGPLEIARSRSYHRQWLLAFQGRDSRSAVEEWTDTLLAVPAETLRPPADDEVYLHELEGFAVQNERGDPLGVVTRVVELPSGVMLEIQGPKREILLPFRKVFVREMDRAARRLVVDVPDGL